MCILSDVPPEYLDQSGDVARASTCLLQAHQPHPAQSHLAMSAQVLFSERWCLAALAWDHFRGAPAVTSSLQPRTPRQE